MFVFENLDLVPRDQSSVIAVKDLNTEDKVKLVARLVRQSRGPSFVPKYRLFPSTSMLWIQEIKLFMC